MGLVPSLASRGYRDPAGDDSRYSSSDELGSLTSEDSEDWEPSEVEERHFAPRDEAVAPAHRHGPSAHSAAFMPPTSIGIPLG